MKSIEAGILLFPNDFPPQESTNDAAPTQQTQQTTQTSKPKEKAKEKLPHTSSLSIPVEDDENLVPVDHAKTKSTNTNTNEGKVCLFVLWESLLFYFGWEYVKKWGNKDKKKAKK